MGCTVDARRRMRTCAAECRARDGVVAVDVLPPAEGPQATWTLEVVCAGAGVPPGVLNQIAVHGLRLAHVDPQGAYTVAVV